MSISAIYDGLRAAYGLTESNNSVDLNRNGTIDDGERLASPQDAKAFLKALVENENNLIVLKKAYDAVSPNNDKKDADLNALESNIVARACLIASQVPENEINGYLKKLGHLFNCYLAYKLIGGSDPGTTSDEASSLHGFLWCFKGKRYGFTCKLNDAIDNQLSYLKSYGEQEDIGDCNALTALFTVLGIRAGMEMKAVRVPGHIFSRAGSRYIENTDIQGSMHGTMEELIRERFTWREELNEFGTVPSILANIGMRLDWLKKYDRAIEVFKLALTVSPGRSADIHNMLGKTYTNLEQYALAKSYLKRSLSLNPKFPEAHFNLGLVHERQGDNDMAIACYRTAIKYRKRFSEPYIRIGIIYNRRGKPETALEWFKKAADVAPRNAEAFKSMGYIHAMSGNYNAAIECLRKAVTLDPEYEDAYVDLGNSYFSLGQYSSAEICYKKALEINPENSKARNNLVMIPVQNK